MLELLGACFSALAALIAGFAWLYAWRRDRTADVPEFAVAAFRDGKPGWGIRISVPRPSDLPLWSVHAVSVEGDPRARVATCPGQTAAGGVRVSENIGAGGQRWLVQANVMHPHQHLHEYELRVMGIEDAATMAKLRLRFHLTRPSGQRRTITSRIPNPRPRDDYI